MLALLTTVLLAQAPGIEVVGEASLVKWGKEVALQLAPGDPVVLQLAGPGVFVAELRGGAKDKGKLVELEILRDGDEVSRNSVTLKARPQGAQKGYPQAARLAIELTQGSHRLAFSVNADGLVLVPLVAAVVGEETRAAAFAKLAPTTVVGHNDAAAAAAALGGARESMPASDTAGLAKALRIAVYDFELSGVGANIGTVVTDSFLAEVRKLQRVSVIGMTEIRDMLSHEANKQMVGCDTESCLAEIAGALGVDQLVSGKLSRVDSSHVLVARRIDQNRAKVLGTVDQRLEAGSGQEFLAAVGPAIEQLFPELPLREGSTRGVPKEMALRLDPPPLPKWSVWAVAGTAVATLAAGGVFGYLVTESEREWDRQLDDGAARGRDLVTIENTAQSRQTMANGMFITTGVLAAAAGVMALFTDWHGYGEAAPAAR